MHKTVVSTSNRPFDQAYTSLKSDAQKMKKKTWPNIENCPFVKNGMVINNQVKEYCGFPICFLANDESNKDKNETNKI